MAQHRSDPPVQRQNAMYHLLETFAPDIGHDTASVYQSYLSRPSIISWRKKTIQEQQLHISIITWVSLPSQLLLAMFGFQTHQGYERSCWNFSAIIAL